MMGILESKPFLGWIQDCCHPKVSSFEPRKSFSSVAGNGTRRDNVRIHRPIWKVCWNGEGVGGAISGGSVPQGIKEKDEHWGKASWTKEHDGSYG